MSCICSSLVPIRKGPAGTGTISGVAYNETYNSPEDLLAEYPVNGILVIDPPVGEITMFVTNASGQFELTDVLSGEYTISPLHCDERYAKTVTVVRNEVAETEIRFPKAGIYYYILNTASATAPFDSNAVRNGLSKALSRHELLAAAGIDDLPPTLHFIPQPLLSGGWASSAAIIEEDDDVADTLLGGSVLNFSVSYNDTAGNAAVFDAFKADLEQLSKIGTITGIPQGWAAHYGDLENGNFEVGRLGYILESNNLVDFYQVIVGAENFGAYDNPTATQLLVDANSALDAGDLDAYETAIIELNDVMVGTTPAIPIMAYVSDSDLTPSAQILGTWAIDVNASENLSANYATLEISSAEVQIADPVGTVFETNSIGSMDNLVLNVTITQQDIAPSMVGNQNLWEYVVLGDRLVIRVYNLDKSTRWAIFIADRVL